MHAISILILASTLGVDYGWQKNARGEWEYIVQVEPALLQTLAEGQPIVSTMPPELDGVRHVVLRVGTGAVPKERLPEVRRMAGTTPFRTVSAATSTPPKPEVVDDWATRPRIDRIPFIERERVAAVSGNDRHSRAGGRNPSSPNPATTDRWNSQPRTGSQDHDPGNTAGRTSLSSNMRSSLPFRERPLPPPPDDTWSGETRSSRSQLDSFDHRHEPRFDDPDERRNRNGVRRDRSDRSNESSQFSESSRTAPPKAAITETKGTNVNATGSSNRAPLQSGGSVTIISLFLFMSLGGNLYLGWLARDFYWRYRDIAWEIRNNQTNAPANTD